jgi:hypothetical protein
MRMEPINGIYYVMVDRVLITGVTWSSISLGMIICDGMEMVSCRTYTIGLHDEHCIPGLRC